MEGGKISFPALAHGKQLPVVRFCLYRSGVCEAGVTFQCVNAVIDKFENLKVAAHRNAFHLSVSFRVYVSTIYTFRILAYVYATVEVTTGKGAQPLFERDATGGHIISQAT